MLQKLKDIVNGRKRLYESREFDVIEDDTEYIIEEHYRGSVGDIFVEFNGQEFSVDKKMKIPKETTKNSNIICKRGSSVEYVIGNVQSAEPLVLYFDTSHLSELKDISVRGEQSENVFDTQAYSVSIWKLDELWAIQISGFKKGIEYSLDLKFTDTYPDVWTRSITLDTVTSLDLSSLRIKKLRCIVPPKLSGVLSIRHLGGSSREEVEISEINGDTVEFNEIVQDKIITKENSFEESIIDWNSADIKIVVKPERYANLTKVQGVSDDFADFEFEEDEFTELGTLTVSYPEFVSLDPYLSYPTDSSQDSYIKPTRITQDNTVVFDHCVYPAEGIRLHSNAFILDNGSKSFDMTEGGSETLEMNPVQVKLEEYIENDLDMEVFCTINEENLHISSGESVSVEVSLSDENTIKITDGSTVLVETTLSRKELLSSDLKISSLKELEK